MLGRVMRHLPPSSSHPLSGHLSESYLPLMRIKQENLRLGDLVPPDSWAQAGRPALLKARETSPPGAGEGAPGLASAPAAPFCDMGLGGWHGRSAGGSEGRFVGSVGGSESFLHVDWRNFNQNSHRGWAWATFPYLAGKRGRD